jgi:hypothetical protein
MADSELLMDYIWNNGFTPQVIAQALDISTQELFNKMYISKFFTKEEISVLEKLLKLSKVDKELIFRF